MERQPILRVARNTLVIQAGLVLVVAVVCLLVRHNWLFGATVVLGGLCGWVPYWYVAWRIVRNVAKPIRQFLAAFMLAELVKFAAAIGLLALCFQIPEVAAYALLLGFGAVIVAQWAFPILLRKELSSDGSSNAS